MVWQLLLAQGAAFLAGKAWGYAYDWATSIKPRQRIEALSPPRVEEGTPLPMFWGTIRIQPSLIQATNFSAVPHSDPSMAWLAIFDEPADEGSWWYRATMLFSLGVPPTQTERVILNRVWTGDKQWPSTANDVGFEPIYCDPDVSTHDDVRFMGSLNVQAGDVVAGKIQLFGQRSDFFSTKFKEEFVSAGWDATLLPNYRPQIKVALTNWDDDTLLVTGQPAALAINGWLFGRSSSPAPYSFEVFTIPFRTETLAPSYYQLSAMPGMNPIGVIHDLMTSSFGKLNIDEADIDLDSFYSAGVTLGGEAHDYSRVIYDLMDARELILEILDQIAGVMYADPVTGKYAIKLIRNDYVVADLPLFNPDNTVGPPEMEIGTWEESFNEVRVKWTNREKDYTPSIAVAQDAANVFGQEEKLRFVERDFPGICNATLAAQVAARELKAVATPTRKLRLTVDRSGHTLRPGGLFRFTWPEWGITDAVFRIGSIDLGLLDDNRVTISAIEDIFSIDGLAIFDSDPENHIPDPPPVEPFAIQERFVVEMPRFLQIQSGIADYDRQHIMYWANPADDSQSYRARVQVGTSKAYDIGWRAFPTRAKVETIYARTSAPYDTTTGLRINNFTQGAIALGSATTAEIQGGKNLILVGSEIMAYESITDIGGGVTRLNNVWRGILDTVPVDHAVGELVYVIPPDTLTLWPDGIFPFELGASVGARLIPRLNLNSIDPELAEEDTIVITERTNRPYPGSRYRWRAETSGPAASDAAITSLEEEGLDLTFNTRAMTTQSVVRGDSAAETVPADTKYFPVVSKTGYSDVQSSAGYSAGSPIVQVSTSRGGYGQFNLNMRTIDENAAGSSDDMFSWQDAVLPVFANRWRNLLINGRFEYGGAGGATGLTGWTPTNATVGTNSALALGTNPSTAFYMATGVTTSADAVAVQEIYVGRWIANNGGGGRLVASLDFYDRRSSGINVDDVTAVLAAYDIGNNLLTSTTYGPTVPSSTVWNHRAITLAIPNSTEYLKITLTAGYVIEATTSSSLIAEAIVRLGHAGSQLLANPDFETGLTSWTTASGTPVATTGTLTVAYTASQYAAGGAGASSELYQEVAIPAGFEYGTALLECAHVNTEADADDTGEVILEARNGAGGSVVATTTTGALTTTASQWQRRRLKLNLPASATHLRVRLLSTRVGDAGDANAGFDDFDLRVHKGLDPDLDVDLSFASPWVSPMPSTMDKWSADQSTVTMPRHGFWNGEGNVGATILDGAPHNYPISLIDPTNTVGMSVPFVGPWDGLTCVHKAYEFSRTGNHDLQVFGSNTFYMAFGVTFSVVAIIRVNEAGFNTECGVLGKRVLGGTGWGIHINSSGTAVATLYGTGGTFSVNITGVSDGAPHMIGFTYDAAAQEIRAIANGVISSAVSTAGIGSFASAGKFRIGRTHSTEAPIPGQIARVYAWYGYELTSTDAAAMWKVFDDAPGTTDIISDISQQARVVKDANGGIAVVRGATAAPAWAWDSRLAVGGASGWGLAVGRALTNLATQDPSLWVLNGVTARFNQRDVEGFLNGVEITGSSFGWIRTDVVLSATTEVRVTCFAKSVTAGPVNINIALLNTNDTAKGNVTVAIQSTEWTRVDVRFTTWDASTANGRIALKASASGTPQTVVFSSPLIVHQGEFFPVAFPFRNGISNTVDDVVVWLAQAPTQQLNVEGEMRINGIHMATENVVGTIARIWNETTNVDQRKLALAVGPLVEFTHADSAGTGVVSERTPGATELANPWLIECRWARAGVVDNLTNFAGLELNNAADYDRVAAWTPGATALTRISLGAMSGGAVFDSGPNAIITRFRVTARELGPGVP